MAMKNLSKPTLLVFKGLPGVGKSTLARELHERTGWPLLVRDDLKEQLVISGVPDPEAGAKSYQKMWAEAEKTLETSNCICDTNLSQSVAVQDLKNIELNRDVRILIIECFAENEVIRSRIEARARERHLNVQIDTWEDFLAFESSNRNQEFEIPYPLLRVDTGTTGGVESILTWVGDNINISSEFENRSGKERM